jgi:hypothetical protein
MKTEHTPGPWVVALSPVRETLCVVGGETWICGELQANNHTRMDSEECEANARLIAAAPELLANLTNLVGLAERRCRSLHEYKAALDDARAAIAKAGLR